MKIVIFKTLKKEPIRTEKYFKVFSPYIFGIFKVF